VTGSLSVPHLGLPANTPWLGAGAIGRKIRLQERPFKVLSLLLRRPGEVVTREELQQALWPEGTFVEFEHSLNTAIKKVRQALGDSAENPRFIETIPRRGYRFIGPANGMAETPLVRPTGRRGLILGLTLALAVVAGIAAWSSMRGRDTPESVVTAGRLTTFPGWERHPSFSPDGNQVAFSWAGEDGGGFDVYVKVLGAESPLRLTSDPADDMSPAWSPDGRTIAFLRSLSGGGAAVFLVPPVAGPERKFAEVSAQNAFWGPSLAWSPDSKWLVVVDKKSADDPFALFALSPETGNKHRLTTPPGGFQGDHESCDFAVVRALRAEGHDVLAVSELQQRSVD
jgi:hypothetical protein